MPSSGMKQPSIEIVNSRYNETCQPMLGQYVYFTTTLPRDSSKPFTIIACWCLEDGKFVNISFNLTTATLAIGSLNDRKKLDGL